MSDLQLSSPLFKKWNVNYRRVALLIFILFGLLNLMIVVVNHYCFKTFAFDYGVYNFAFFDFAHCRVSPCPVYSYQLPITFLQDHFSLALIVFSPLYWLLAWITGTYTLLLIQWALIMWGGWATYRLILIKSNNYKLALFALIYFFVLYGRYSAYDGDCNLAIMGSAMVPVLLYYFEIKNLKALTACFLFLVVTREDYPVWLTFIFLFLMLLHRKDAAKRKLAAWFFFASLCFIVLTFKVFIPALENQYKQYGFFEFHIIGKTPGEAALFLFQHPLKALELLFVNHSGDPANDKVKLTFYIVYLLSGGALLFIRPLYLIPFLPLLAKKMYTDTPFRWSIESYYCIEFASLLPVMVFLIICQLNRAQLKYALGMIICMVSLAVTVRCILAGKELTVTYDTNKSNFLAASFYTSLYNRSDLEAAMNSIPKTAGVSASCRLVPHMALREKIYYFPRVDDAEYIFLLKHNDAYYLSNEAYAKWIADLRVDTDWMLIQEKEDFIMFYRPKK